MKTINIKTIMGASAFALACLVTNQTEASQTIQIDKGNVTIEFGKFEKKFDYVVRKSSDCLSDVKVEESSGVVTFTNDDQCQRGANITLKLDSSNSYEVALKNGAAKLLQSSSVLKSVSKLRATVSAGMIQTNVPGLIPSSINSYAGSEVTYKGKDSSSLPELTIRVQNGMIQL